MSILSSIAIGSTVGRHRRRGIGRPPTFVPLCPYVLDGGGGLAPVSAVVPRRPPPRRAAQLLPAKSFAGGGGRMSVLPAVKAAGVPTNSRRLSSPQFFGF